MFCYIPHGEKFLRDVAIDYNAYFGYYFAQADKIHKDYNWDQLTKKAFEHLAEKFN